MGVMDDLERARDAYERRAWVAAYVALSEADPSVLDAADFARLATAAHLVGRTNDGVQAMQRAFQVYLESGDTLTAIRCGSWLAMVLLTNGEPAVGGGWAARCQRLLEDVDEDVVERGHALSHAALVDIFAGDFASAAEKATRVTDYGRRFGDADLLATGLMSQGRILIYSGQVREGLALLDEAMVGITTGEVSPLVAGEVYCSLIEGCQEVSDWGRVAAWTASLTHWTGAQPGMVKFTGQCAVHRGQIMRLRGAFEAAIKEFERAVERYLEDGHTPPAGQAMTESGDVLRVLGRHDEAEAAYQQAIGFGHEPQPGLALLWLSQGRTDTAVAAVRRLLAERNDPVHRTQVLPGAVEVLLAAGLVDEAAIASQELTGAAAAFGCKALQALAHVATAGVRRARGEPGAAAYELRAGLRHWQALDAPWEAARARSSLGEVLRELDDEESARAELAEAARVFADLGATPDARRVTALLGRSAPGGLTEREVEVLRLVAVGKSNPEIAGQLVLSEKTVARHLSNIFTKLDVGNRTAAAAYAFEHRLM